MYENALTDFQTLVVLTVHELEQLLATPAADIHCSPCVPLSTPQASGQQTQIHYFIAGKLAESPSLIEEQSMELLARELAEELFLSMTAAGVREPIIHDEVLV